MKVTKIIEAVTIKKTAKYKFSPCEIGGKLYIRIDIIAVFDHLFFINYWDPKRDNKYEKKFFKTFGVELNQVIKKLGLEERLQRETKNND